MKVPRSELCREAHTLFGLLPKITRLNFGLGAETGEGYGTAFAASRQIGGIDCANNNSAGANVLTDSLSRYISVERCRPYEVLLRQWHPTRVLIRTYLKIV